MVPFSMGIIRQKFSLSVHLCVGVSVGESVTMLPKAHTSSVERSHRGVSSADRATSTPN
jgi:hypothetical protein